MQQKIKYQYGYKFNGTRMNKQIIMLPVNEKKEPDYRFMENYMKQLELNKLKKYLEYKETEWKKNGVEQSIKIIAEIVVNMKIVTRIKFNSKLKYLSSAIGYYSYTNRYALLNKN